MIVNDLSTAKYSDESRLRILAWMKRVEPTGFVGFHPKAVRPKHPGDIPRMEVIEILEE